jgi:hypothetical protein
VIAFHRRRVRTTSDGFAYRDNHVRVAAYPLVVASASFVICASKFGTAMHARFSASRMPAMAGNASKSARIPLQTRH